MRCRSYHRNDKALVNTSKQAEQQAEPTSKILHSTDQTGLPKRNVPAIPNDEDNLQQSQIGQKGQLYEVCEGRNDTILSHNTRLSYA